MLSAPTHSPWHSSLPRRRLSASCYSLLERCLRLQQCAGRRKARTVQKGLLQEPPSTRDGGSWRTHGPASALPRDLEYLLEVPADQASLAHMLICSRTRSILTFSCVLSPFSYRASRGHLPNRPLALKFVSQGLLLGKSDQDNI